MIVSTLRGQLTLASALTTVVALLLTAGALLLFERAAYRSDWVDDLKTQAELIASSTAAALVFNDPEAATATLKLLEVRAPIRAAALYREGGIMFAEYRSSPEEPIPAGTDSTVVSDGQRFQDAVLEVAYPVLHDGERVGTVYLRAEHDVGQRLAGYLAILASVLAVSLGLAVLVFERLLRSTAAPLLKVTKVAQRVVRRRDWSLRAPEAQARELSVLVHAFNRMLAEVEAATGELERETVERRQAEEQLKLADRRKDEFLAMLAHELRNPLAPMTNAVALLGLPKASTAMREKAIAILDRQLKHIVRLIDDLLDVSRIATGKLSLNFAPVDLADILRLAAELVEPQMREKGLELSVDIPSQACIVVADSARLQQVFQNLLSNARHYTPAGGLVALEMSTAPDAVEVSVRDTGIGIDPAVQGRIFELFEQADKTLERGNAGLGIGLTLARQLIRLHGGDVSLQSEGIGHGSRFTVRLSRPEQALEVVEEPEIMTATPGSRSLHLVLADDNVDLAASLKDLLESLGHSAVAVHDGESALSAVAAEKPDVVLLDIGMPGMNGYDVARCLRADPATASLMLVAITGWGQASDKENAAKAGFDHHLVKPVAPEELLKVLASFQPAVSGKQAVSE